MKTASILTPAARANKLFGTNGGLMLTLYDTFPGDFTLDTPLFARIDGLDVPLWVERFERRGRAGAVVHFADIDTERRAAELVGKELFSDDPGDDDADADDNTFYMEDLIGFAVEASEVGSDLHLHGTLSDYYDSEANPLFEVTSATNTQILIPAVEEFIARIDFDARSIHFVLPEGLAGLNLKNTEG